MKPNREALNKLLFSNKRVFFGGNPSATPKPKIVFFRVTEKKAPARHPTMEESSQNSDASGGQSAEEMGDLQTFLINFSLP